MPLRPGLSLLPTTTIRLAILKQIGYILVEGGLMVLGYQELVSLKPMDLRTQHTLGMHGIQGEDTPCDQLRGQQRLERYSTHALSLPHGNAITRCRWRPHNN